MRSRGTLISIVILSIFIGWIIGWFTHSYRTHSSPQLFETHQNSGEYRFISPLLECNTPQFAPAISVNLKLALEQTISKLTAQSGIKDISLYYRDLNNGAWLGFNEKEKFAPASLLKVPVLIAVLKQAQVNPQLLSASLTYNNEFANDKNLPPASDQSLIPGQTYTISTLLEKMISFSDNLSKDLLREILEENAPGLLNEVYLDLGLYDELQDAKDLDIDIVNVKDYAGFFRILFNASYLNRDMSEKALSFLTKSAFTEGIIAGLPNNIIVAHKFGYREIPNKPFQLHDCGIVYLPQHPYLLCIMTRGSSNQQMLNGITTLSRTIYQQLSK